MTEGVFLGKPIPYWLELESQAKSMRFENLILEIARLRAKVSYYENKMLEMSEFMNTIDGEFVTSA